MAQYLSEDLRIRVIRAVEGGMSRNGAASRFGISIASAVRWLDVYLKTGRTAAKPRGMDRRSGRIKAQADLLLGAIEDSPDTTLAELRERLIEERGETFEGCDDALGVIVIYKFSDTRVQATPALKPQKRFIP